MKETHLIRSWLDYIEGIAEHIKALPHYDADDPDRDQLFSIWETENFYTDWSAEDRWRLLLDLDRDIRRLLDDGRDELAEMDWRPETFPDPVEWGMHVLAWTTFRHIYLTAW